VVRVLLITIAWLIVGGCISSKPALKVNLEPNCDVRIMGNVMSCGNNPVYELRLLKDQLGIGKFRGIAIYLHQSALNNGFS